MIHRKQISKFLFTTLLKVLPVPEKKILLLCSFVFCTEPRSTRLYTCPTCLHGSLLHVVFFSQAFNYRISPRFEQTTLFIHLNAPPHIFCQKLHCSSRHAPHAWYRSVFSSLCVRNLCVFCLHVFEIYSKSSLTRTSRGHRNDFELSGISS